MTMIPIAIGIKYLAVKLSETVKDSDVGGELMVSPLKLNCILVVLIW